MGCCCSCCSDGARDDSEFQKTATSPLVAKSRAHSFPDTIPSNITKTDLALTVQLLSASGIKATAAGDCDPYVRFWLSDDPGSAQESTCKARTVKPVWSPPETFTFMPIKSSGMKDKKLVVSLMDKDLIGQDDPLGDCVVKLGTLPVGSAGSGTRRLALINGSTGEETGAYVDARISVDLAFKAFGTQEEKAYQYERWDVIHKWSSEHLLPSDPGRWSNFERTEYKGSFEEVARELGEGWSVERPWEVCGRPGSTDGWEYAFGFRFPGWFDKPYFLMRARRRVWRRVVVNNNIIHEAESSS
mmetsp:Transcript_113/g.248  ORF Transcript_113/g.248 Transcript_113/m.248 type:complete len:301 (-) Transcript_113:46-948(-)